MMGSGTSKNLSDFDNADDASHGPATWRPEGMVGLAGVIIVTLMTAAMLAGWRSNDDLLYRDPAGCRTVTCARMTSTGAERTVITRALGLIEDSRFAATATGRDVTGRIKELEAQGRINVWTLRQLDHSRYHERHGIMINRSWQDLTPELVAVAIVHEAVHGVLPESTYPNELAAFRVMLGFYRELAGSRGWTHPELDYLASLDADGGLDRHLSCQQIFNRCAEGVRHL